MQLVQPFDARSVEPSVGFIVPPPLAEYTVVIVDSDVKTTKAQDGGYLQLMMQVIDQGSPYQNKRYPVNLNLYNKEASTCEIAYKMLSSIMHVIQVIQIADTRQLHDRPFKATLGPQKNDPTYVQLYAVKDMNGNAPGQPATAPATAPVTYQPNAPVQYAQPVAPTPAAQWAPPGTPTPAPAYNQPPYVAPVQPAAAWQPPAQAYAPQPTAAPVAAPPVWTGVAPAAPPLNAAPWGPPR